MCHEAYGEDYSSPPDPNLVKFIESVSSWKGAGYMLFPQDVFNMLIDSGIISQYELERLIKQNLENPKPAKLPEQHVTM